MSLVTLRLGNAILSSQCRASTRRLTATALHPGILQASHTLTSLHARFAASMPSTASSSSASSALSSAIQGSHALKQRASKASTPVTTTREHSTSGHDHKDHHGHSHGLLGHSHSHSHGADAEEVQALAQAFSGSGDRGSRIILLGLASNVALTIAKGVGGVMLHSASLLADAGHSLSDLLGDIVVLFSWRLSRRPASKAFQFGYGM